MKVHYHVHKSPRSPNACVTLHNKLVVYGEELLAPCPTSKKGHSNENHS